MTESIHFLDENRLFPLRFSYDAEEQTLHVQIDQTDNPGNRFQRNIYQLLTCESTQEGATKIKRSFAADGSLLFHPVPSEFHMRLGAEPFLTYRAAHPPIISDHRPINSSQSRMYGTHHGSKVSCRSTNLNTDEYARLRKLATNTITTDFHTHSSGQITAASLLKVAKENNAFYPLHLLAEVMTIAEDRFRPDQIVPQKRIEFAPLEPQDLPDTVDCVRLSDLTDAELHKLELSMSLRTDRQSSYTDAENDCYQLRYPLTKNTDITVESYKQMAHESLAAGLKYVEISCVGLDNPALFRKMHEAIHAIESDPETRGFTLRLKHGIPRTQNTEDFHNALERAKFIVKSPYVCGIDVLGYETTKTLDFKPEIEDFAKWMKKSSPNTTLCIHAGENDKNPENVLEVLRIAKKYDTNVRIGHGLYGLSDEAITLARDLSADANNPRIFIEANPDSNIALNNSDFLIDIPLRRMLDNNIPFVVSSDSLGLYQTSPSQLGQSLICAGFREPDFEKLAHWQRTLLDRQQSHAAEKAAAIPDWATNAGKEQFMTSVCNEIVAFNRTLPVREVKKPTRDELKAEEYALHSHLERAFAQKGITYIRNPRHLSADLENLKPITIVGASGSSFESISPDHQRQIELAYNMLVHAVDPTKVYFAQGRNKKEEGINSIVNRARREVREKTGILPKSIGLLTEPTPDGSISYSHLSHLVRIKSQLNVADDLVDFTVAYDGALIAAGGAAFTRDIILKGDRRMEKRNKGTLLIMDGPKGASSDKARVMDDSYLFREGKELLTRLHEQCPDFLLPNIREALDPQQHSEAERDATLRRLYNEATTRMRELYGSPDASNQIPRDITPPTPERHR